MLKLTTPRLVLRDFVESDWRWLHAIESDPRVTRYMSFDPRSEDQAREHVAERLKDQQAEPRRVFYLAVQATGIPDPIGRCGLSIDRPEHLEAQIGYCMSPAHWGRGYTTEACRALLDYAFGPLGMHRVFADADPRNTASIRVAEKLGMQREAHLRENYWVKGEWCDAYIYAILANEHATRSPSKRDHADVL